MTPSSTPNTMRASMLTSPKPNIGKCDNFNSKGSCDKFPCMYKHSCLRCGSLHSMLHRTMTTPPPTPIACPLKLFVPSVPTINHNPVLDHKKTPPQIVTPTTRAKPSDHDSATPIYGASVQNQLMSLSLKNIW